MSADSQNECRDLTRRVDRVAHRALVRVLVADDRSEDRLWLATMLHRRGYEVSQAADGRELLDMLFAVPSGHFDVVLCDHWMPGRLGTECLSLAASRARWIIVTASNEPAVERSAALFGAAAVIHKPFDAATIVETLESVLPDGPVTGMRRHAPL